MRNLFPLLLVAAIAGCTLPAAEPSGPPLSCVASSDCGCSIRVSADACPNGGSHFFHELTDGAPLQFDLGHGPALAVSTRPRTGQFTPAPGESWTETYHHGADIIQIHYSPGASTCPKPRDDEPCELFDVNARVEFSGPQGTRRYTGVGSCGC